MCDSTSQKTPQTLYLKLKGYRNAVIHAQPFPGVHCKLEACLYCFPYRWCEKEIEKVIRNVVFGLVCRLDGELAGRLLCGMAHRMRAEGELYLERLDFRMTMSVLGTAGDSGSCTCIFWSFLLTTQ